MSSSGVGGGPREKPRGSVNVEKHLRALLGSQHSYLEGNAGGGCR
jgi:hypothetical protein